MEKHIKTVGILQIAYSILGLLLGIVLYVVFNLIGDFVDDPTAETVLSIIANVLIAIWTIFCIPGLLAGIGLLKRKEWARILTIILSVIELLSFPLGTILGVYSIWAMTQPEVLEALKNNSESTDL